MNVSVFGLGCVGCVSAASFAGDGHHVIGVDVNQGKVDAVNAGRSPSSPASKSCSRRTWPKAACARPPARRRRSARPTSRCCAWARQAGGTAARSPISRPPTAAARSRTSRPITSSWCAALSCRERRTRWSPALEGASGKTYGEGSASPQPGVLQEAPLKDSAGRR